MRRTYYGAMALLLVVVTIVCGQTALRPDTLPAQYSDAEFWKLITDFSEPGGSFPYENFVSNEVNYQSVLADVNAAHASRWCLPGGCTGAELHLHRRNSTQSGVHFRYPQTEPR
jgi:hypothetical protein